MNWKLFKRPQWIPRWLNVPLVIVAAFIVYLFFMGDNNFIKSWRYRHEANELKREIEMNLDSAKYYDDRVRELNTDRETLEKIAREQYGMKREGEEVYITDLP